MALLTEPPVPMRMTYRALIIFLQPRFPIRLQVELRVYGDFTTDPRRDKFSGDNLAVWEEIGAAATDTNDSPIEPVRVRRAMVVPEQTPLGGTIRPTRTS